ncbi:MULTISPECIES: type IV secretory system conjugative DNA transfer family protein [Kordiimonas]|jgi:hypothetical protein|uniref:type IV secretory system conjugative DNA transfer family protein n=1 Tax=Kordiimonas TaxID=288021 RepID=UPI00257CCC79|nr:type IV secretion system DNA-binding domain-containing protein [Kordiimonas sp. UBA4487]
MPLHAGARFHAFVNGLFQPSEERETWRLYRKAERLFEKNGLADPQGRTDLATHMATDITERLGRPAEPEQVISLTLLILDLFNYEGLFLLPDFDCTDTHTIAEHFDLRAELKRQRDLMTDFDGACTCFKNALSQCLHAAYSAMPSNSEDGITFTTNLLDSLANANTVIEDMMLAFWGDIGRRRDLFTCLQGTFSQNLILASGNSSGRSMRWPEKCNIKDPTALCDTYLVGTPLRRILDQPLTISIPQETRFEHTHILGGTGHGKTQLLQYLIHHDLKQAEEDELSIVVVDNQGDLIRKLSRLNIFTGSLAEHLIIIDPTDIEHPPALNLFDAGLDRLDEYTPRQRELAFNSLVDIYGRFFGALLGAELTARQGAVFRYIARLMLTIPKATIHTMIELMDDVQPFQEYIKKLDPTAKRFFEQEFSKKGFNATRQQIKQRLYTVLSIPTFDRLFSAPKSKINFFDALNDGSIILVNTAKDLLKADGAAIFGRFVLSLIEHAIMERATLDADERMPTFLYVDEAQDYFDETIETMLVQGRKFNFGLTLAHQNLAQLSPRLNAVLAGNTTIKFAGGISDKDARSLASDMRTTGAMLLSMQKRGERTEFALSVRNQTPHALKVNVEFGHLENCAVMTDAEYVELVARNCEHVCYVPEAPQPEPNWEPQAATAAPESAVSSQDPMQVGHRAIQEEIAAKAKKHGFAASVEYVLPNDKRVDVALFGHGLRIAVEVSVTNRQEYELSNIEKALEAGFGSVWMIAADGDHLDQLRQYIRNKLPPDKWACVLFGTSCDASAWMQRYSPCPNGSPNVAGFDTHLVIVATENTSDRSYRTERLRDLIRQ